MGVNAPTNKFYFTHASVPTRSKKTKGLCPIQEVQFKGFFERKCTKCMFERRLRSIISFYSESGSDSPNHHLLNSHQHHGQQQMVANSMVSPSMQQCAPTPVFTSLSNLAPVGVSRANDTSMANSKNIMSLPHAVTPIPVSQPNQMHGAPNIMPG